jgi:hypothetical protein
MDEDEVLTMTTTALMILIKELYSRSFVLETILIGHNLVTEEIIQEMTIRAAAEIDSALIDRFNQAMDIAKKEM